MQTPLRRSKRGQPVVEGLSSHKLQDGPSTIAGDVLHTRQLMRGDLTFEQYDQLQAKKASLDGLRTRFHHNFTRSDSVKRSAKVYGVRRRAPRVDENDFCVGNTALVATQGKEPSIAVITGVWTIEEDGEILYTNISLHWFLRPGELPNIRAKHSHVEVWLISLIMPIRNVQSSLGRNLLYVGTQHRCGCEHDPRAL